MKLTSRSHLESPPALGLRRHTVQLLPPRPDWAALGAQAASRVLAVAGPEVLDVQHVGSTAVPGLPAKPILDLVMALPCGVVTPDLQARLAEIGYLYRGNHGNDGGHLFLHEAAPDIRTVHLHGLTTGGTQWHQYLRFRDALRHDAALRARYAALKQALATSFADDRAAYSAGKHDFIRAALAALRP